MQAFRANMAASRTGMRGQASRHFSQFLRQWCRKWGSAFHKLVGNVIDFLKTSEPFHCNQSTRPFPAD